MKQFAALALAIPMLICSEMSQALRPSEPSQTAKPETPFACNRLALNEEQRKRHFDDLSPELRRLKTQAVELPDGFEFQFPSDKKTFELVAEWIDGERVCCPFFDIDLRSQRETGSLTMRLTGRDGVKQFIRADFAKWFLAGIGPSHETDRLAVSADLCSQEP